MDTTAPSSAFDPSRITRPDPVLRTYYIIMALFTLVAFPITLVVFLCKYHTLTYRFDDKGIAMSWGVLFKREIYLTYRRIQDIHVTRNILHRWLGLASISVQTASGAAGAEMTIEGIREVDALRDYLYAQMRGAREDDSESEEAAAPSDHEDEALQVLCEIRDELRSLRQKREVGS